MFTFERLRASLSTQSGKKFLATAFVALFVVIGITASLHGVLAQGDTPAPAPAAAPVTTPAPADPGAGACGTEPLDTVCGWVAALLGLFADFVGRLILLVLSVLIAFAQYNDFGNAIPVQEGWVVVRDTTNMFFIIILLLTAFATVIGRDEFHYSKILPKLLLQAVLINFSKTLILLAVDFSQVVMLTFVNAFAQSAAGNFVYALGLDKMMQLGSNIGNIDFGKIIIAYFLAISFMIIALGVIIILTAYLIYRIVALWVTIIIAPLAFFATAVPDKFRASIGAIGQEYWKRLTNLLTAGPVIAFFLWLTLAVTQQSNQASNDASTQTLAAGQGLAGALNLVRPESAGQDTGSVTGLIGAGADNAIGATFGFLNEIADSAHIASFIVGITMMLMALDTAVASAAAMGGLAAYIGKKTKSIAGSIAKAPFTGAAGLAKGSFNAVDRRLDLTRKASLAGTKLLSKTPAMLRGETYDKVRGGLLKGVNYRRTEAAKQAKEDADYKEALSSKAKSLEERQALLGLGSAARTQKEGLLPPTMASKAVESYYQEQFGDKDMIEKEYKATKNKYEADLVKQGFSASEAKAGSEVRVREELNERQRQALGARYDIAKKSGNEDEQKKIEELLKLNPHLARSGDERKGYVKKMIDSPELYKDIPKETYMNGEFLTDLMLANGWSEVMGADGKTVIGIQETDKDAWDLKKKEMRLANSGAADAMIAHERFTKLSTDKTPDQLRKMQHVKNLADNTVHTYSTRDDASATPGMKAGTRVRNSSQTAALAASKRDSGDTKNPINVKGMSDGMSYGASLPETLKNAGYSENDQAPLQAFASQYIGADTATAIANINTDEAKMAEIYQSMSDTEIKDINKAYTRDLKDLTKDYTDQITAATTASNTAEVERLTKERDQAVIDMTNTRDQLLAEARAQADPNNISAKAKQTVREGLSKAQELVAVLSQTGTKGVGRAESEVLLGQFLKNGGVEIIKNIDRYDVATKQRILAMVDKIKDIADDVSREGASGANKEFQEIISEAQNQLIRELPKKGTGQQVRKQLTAIPKSNTTV